MPPAVPDRGHLRQGPPEAWEEVALKEGRFHTWRRSQPKESPPTQYAEQTAQNPASFLQKQSRVVGTLLPSEATLSSNSNPFSLPLPPRQ